MTSSDRNIFSYLYLEPLALMGRLTGEFTVDLSELSEGIRGADTFSVAQKKLYELNADFSFLITVLAYAKVELRKCARNHAQEKTAENKRAHEDMTDRVYCIDTVVTLLKKQSEMVSRLITAKQEENKEINMNTGC